MKSGVLARSIGAALATASTAAATPLADTGVDHHIGLHGQVQRQILPLPTLVAYGIDEFGQRFTLTGRLGSGDGKSHLLNGWGQMVAACPGY